MLSVQLAIYLAINWCMQHVYTCNFFGSKNVKIIKLKNLIILTIYGQLYTQHVANIIWHKNLFYAIFCLQALTLTSLRVTLTISTVLSSCLQSKDGLLIIILL